MSRVAALLLIACLAVPASGGEDETVTGRVVDEQGRPLVGARVHVGQYWPGGTAKTDPEGRFRVTVAADMPAPISIFANGFRTKRLEVEPGTRGVRIVLDPGIAIRGTLRVPEGASMPRAATVVTANRASRSMQAVVNADGAFTIHGFDPSPKPVAIALHAAGFSVVRQTRSIDSEHGVIEMGEIPLVVGRALTVLVRDHHDKALPDAKVIVRVERMHVAQWMAVSDAEGRVHLPATSNDELEVEGHFASGHPHATKWSVAPGAEPVVLTVRMEPSILLSGKLVWAGPGAPPWAGKDATSVLAAVYSEGKQLTTWFGRTNGEGKPSFVLEKGRAGRFELVVSVSLERWWRSARIPVDVPRSALDSGRFDLGAVRIAPKER